MDGNCERELLISDCSIVCASVIGRQSGWIDGAIISSCLLWTGLAYKLWNNVWVTREESKQKMEKNGNRNDMVDE